MAKIGVSLKINVSQIEKERLFAGSKGKYLDMTVFIDLEEFDQYGNSGMVTQDITKDEKSNGVKAPILGNSKVFWSQGIEMPLKPGEVPEQNSQSNNYVAPQNNGQPPVVDKDDDIPF